MTIQENLIHLIPEFNCIHDDDLRRRTLAVWKEALELGGWTLDELSTLPFTLLVDEVKVSFPEHVSTVCKLCIAMEDVLKTAFGDRFAIEHDTLVAGALLADVGKLLEFSKSDDGTHAWAEMYQYLRHPFTAVGLCFKHDIPPAVMHVIATHSWEGDQFKRRPESIIFHHADFTNFDLSRYK
jgi:hypothetical protein